MGLVFPPLALRTLAASPALMALPAPLTFKGRAPSSISHITQLPLVGLASISLSESSAFYTCGVKNTAPAQGSGQALGGTCDAPTTTTAIPTSTANPMAPSRGPWTQPHFPFSWPSLEAKFQPLGPPRNRARGHLQCRAGLCSAMFGTVLPGSPL